MYKITFIFDGSLHTITVPSLCAASIAQSYIPNSRLWNKYGKLI